MKLEFLSNISEGRKYTNIVVEKLIRLYNFDSIQAERLLKIIQEVLITDKKPLKLTELDFIEPLNCRLELQISDEDKGISSVDNKNFICNLTLDGYARMMNLIEPFCIHGQKGYQWLYEPYGAAIEFLFLPQVNGKTFLCSFILKRNAWI